VFFVVSCLKDLFSFFFQYPAAFAPPAAGFVSSHPLTSAPAPASNNRSPRRLGFVWGFFVTTDGLFSEFSFTTNGPSLF
jgi:hypothetical protein